MPGLMESLRQRVEQTRRDLDTAKKVTQKARADEEMLAAELAGYERALAAEERREGKVSPAVPSDTVGDDHEAAATNKTVFAEDYIKSKNGIGVTPPELFRAFQNAGIVIHRNYVYSIIARLEKKGAIKMRRGKYVPATVGESEP